MVDDKFLNINDLCEKLKLSRSSLERLRKGTLPASRYGEVRPFPLPALTIGRCPLWSANDLNQWISS